MPEITEVASGVYRLGSHSHNFYLVVDHGEVTMIDAGCRGEWSVLTGALEQLDLSLDSVAGVVVTHVHSDHFGLARQAHDSGITVSVHSEETERAVGTYTGRFAVKPFELPIFSLRTWRNFLPLIGAGVMRLDHLDTVGTFVDGDVLDLPGRPWAIHTPGHTEGHTMFLLNGRGVLFTGDGLVTMDLLGGGAGPQVMDDRFHVDPAGVRAALGRIVDVDAQLLLPGHGDPWSGTPRDAVKAALHVP